jgi:type IV pilus assembly protein PilW
MQGRTFEHWASGISNMGHSLIELMIAIALGALVVVGSASLYQAQRETARRLADAAALRDAGMTALLLVGQHIEMGGFVPIDALVGSTAPASIDIEPAVFGCDAGVPMTDDDPSACRFVAGGSDAVVARYIDDGVATWPNAAGQATDCLGQGVGRRGERVVIANRFYVARGEGGEPQLYCDGNGGGKQPIVSGIERLKVRYWLRGATAAVPARAIDRRAWANVVAVDLCVQVRGRSSAFMHLYADCDGVPVTSLDGRLRQTFMRRVAVRNHERHGESP